MAAVRSSKVIECGLEVPRRVIYQGWEPGGEYTKPLVVKNVQLQTQKIKYTIKGDQFHSAVYPRPIVLSAGMSYTLPIVFKPRKNEPCEQCIELETAEGAIAVPLRAVLPCVTVQLPESLMFGLCAVKDTLSFNFQISNTSNFDAKFSWECSNDCFIISPNNGELPSKTSHKISATFSPESARVYSGVATCSYWRDEAGEKKHGTIELKGIGKYPHVVVRLPHSKSKVTERRCNRDRGRTEREQGSSRDIVENRREIVVEFGSVAVGTSTQKLIELKNVSAVAANLSIVPSSNSRLSPAHFTCTQSSSLLPPHTSHLIPLTFSPILPYHHSTFAFFDVHTQGGLSTTTIKCIGAAKAPRVEIEDDVLNFGNLLCGQSSTALLHVSNHSDVTALLQLQLEAGSVFRVDSTCIKLPPNSSHKIPLYFTPYKPVPYYKRITCLAQHQEPLFVHLIGTAYTETIRPVVLKRDLINNYIINVQSGVTKLPPEKQLKESKLIASETNGQLEPCDIELNKTRDAPVSPFTNYIHSRYDPSGIVHVSVDIEEIKFGCVSAGNVSDAKNLHVTNHTQGTVSCVWMTGSSDKFMVTPEEKDIAPGTTCLFTAHFKPEHPGKFYCEEMECFAFYKCLQNYQNVTSVSGVRVTPPWCLAVRAHGHSFNSYTHTFTPKMVFETRDIVFPASSPLEPVYRSMTVWNDGNTPAMFEIIPDPKQIFTIKPLSGLIPMGQYQTFVMEMLPQEAKTYKHISNCLLNANTNHTQELLLSGTAELSPISLENQGHLFFKPTCVGSTASADLRIINTAHLPLRYEWKFNGEGTESINVDPKQGMILPSESQTHKWQFSPLKATSLVAKAVLYTTTTTITNTCDGREGIDRFRHSHRKQHKAILDLFGQGLLGEIQCQPSRLEFGTVTIGTSHTHTITLINPSLCALHYSLNVVLHTSASGEETNSSLHGVRLDPCEGVLHAHSSQLVHVTVRPVKTTPYNCLISYRLISTNPAVTLSDSTVLCGLEVTGAYPSLVVTDIHGDQVAAGLSKARLWEMLSIDSLNGHLKEEPHPSELRYAIATRHSMRRRVSIHTRAIEEFNFGAAPLDSGCSVVHLVLENRGRVESQWGFQFPSDMHLEPEYWADSGALDETERHHHDIITNELFTVSPKTGTLAPGDSVSITCSFKHTHIGNSRLPVLLKIHRGREVLLNWSGVTVERGIPHVFFTSHYHTFNPVPIGGNAYPTQTYELHNMGEGTVTYEVDTAPMQALTHTNYLMPILQCLSTQGEIPSRGTATLPFIFSPLEAKKYSVDVPISFSTGESVLVTFSGEGLDPVAQPHTQSTDKTQSSSVTHIHSPHSHPLINPHGQLASLSTENLSLGHLPLFSPVRQLVFLTNLHSSHTVSFHWALTSAEAAAEVVHIQPTEGYINPGKSCASCVTFYSHSSPAIYQLDIICKVVDENEMLEYQLKLDHWTAKQEEKKHTFTISHPHKHISDEEGRPQTIPKQKTLHKSTLRPRSSSNSDLRGTRYQVLPPIGANPPNITYEEWKTQDLSVKSKARPRPSKSLNDEPPYPPTPLLLHLGVTAQTLSLTDYAHQFGDLDKFYIAPKTQLPIQKSGTLRMKTEEKNLIISILGQMARELLDDSSFQAALDRVHNEPVTYFTQLTSSPEHIQTTQEAEETAANTATMGSTHRSTNQEFIALSDEAVERTRETSEEEEGEAAHRQDIMMVTQETPNIMESSPEVKGLIESILENTLFNIMRESDAGEFNITAPHYLVAQYND